ncbi:O-antigen ligase family protein [Pelagibacteraceae bacterium]|nr:O-antigen ligase family protein [Pelagibacteraceae bacterium]
MFLKNLLYQMEISKKILSFFLILLPISLISGPAIPDITITLSSIFFLIYLIYKNNIKYLYEHSWLKVALVFWTYLLISSFFAYNVTEALSNSFIFIRYIMIPLILLYFIFENNFLKKYIIITIFSSIIFVIFDTFYQFLRYDSFNGFKSDIFGYVPDFAKFNRLTGPFKDLVPGAYISKFSFIGLVFFTFYFKNILVRNTLIMIYLAICGYITFISGERMAFATFGLGMIIFMIFTKKNKIFIALSIFLMVLLIFLSIKFHPSYNDYEIIESSSIEYGLVVEKEYNCNSYNSKKCSHLVKLQPTFIEVIKDFNNSAYGEIYSLAINMYKSHFIFGIGLNNYTELCKTDKFINNLQNVGCVTHPHNFYLQWLVETGPLGLILFIIFVIFLFKHVQNNKDYSGRLISFITLIIIFWPIMSTGSFVKNWMGVSSFFAIGLAICMDRLRLDK